jgi:hypothetical protein
LYKKALEEFELNTILSSKFDDFGEITHSSVVDDLKKFATEFILQIKTVNYSKKYTFLQYSIDNDLFRRNKFHPVGKTYGKCSLIKKKKLK